MGSIHGSGWSPGVGNGNPLHILAWKVPWTERSLVGYNPWCCKESDTIEHTCVYHTQAWIGKFLVNLTNHWARHNPQVTLCPRLSMTWPSWISTPPQTPVLFLMRIPPEFLDTRCFFPSLQTHIKGLSFYLCFCFGTKKATWPFFKV